MALTDKLSAIGTAIREKTGKSELMTLDAMPDEIRGISGGGGGTEVEPIVLTGDQTNGCASQIASNYIKLFGNTISTKDITKTNSMFKNFLIENIPFDINCSISSRNDMVDMFCDAKKLEECPNISKAQPSSISKMFYGCINIRKLQDNLGLDWDWDYSRTYSSCNWTSIFTRCSSLRKIPEGFLNNLYGSSAYYYSPYGSTYQYCYSLDEINGIGVHQGLLNSNCFTSTFTNCSRVKNIIFAVNEDGTAKTAQWESQTMNLHDGIGYSYGSKNHILDYNSGITADKEVFDDATYQALKNDPDWFASDLNYSRYNHDSAVNTINSLPDTSAYLAEKGGTNTIKFKGAAGSKTDGGAINTLTEEEIAVATAKGWTVSLV